MDGEYGDGRKSISEILHEDENYGSEFSSTLLGKVFLAISKLN
jgi:hypothetical protein